MIKLTTSFAILCVCDALWIGGLPIGLTEFFGRFVFLKMYTRDNSTGILITDNIDVICPTKPIKIIVHGYIENPKKEWVGKMTKALLNKYDCSVIIVDYTFLAYGEYVLTIQLGKVVGMHVGKFIFKLYQKASIPLQRFQVIGHSLGSHVAGFVGKTVIQLTGQKIWKITSLDAAGPVFRYFRYNMNQRLSSEDAEIVENLHTDDGRLGYEFPIGTIDIYANGGIRPQPGCYTRFKRDTKNTRKRRRIDDILSKILICSHIKSHDYYIRALNGEQIPMTKCDSYEFFQDGLCASNDVINLTQDVSKEVRGFFYFDIDK